MSVVLIVVVISTLCVDQSIALTENLLANPGFEWGNIVWNCGGHAVIRKERDGVAVHTGEYYLYAGGWCTDEIVYQVVNVSEYRSWIDDGDVKAQLGGWLRCYENDGDEVDIELHFFETDLHP